MMGWEKVLEALDALPVKELEDGTYYFTEGRYCAVGCLLPEKARELDYNSRVCPIGSVIVRDFRNAVIEASGLTADDLTELQEINDSYQGHGPEDRRARYAGVRTFVEAKLRKQGKIGKLGG